MTKQILRASKAQTGTKEWAEKTVNIQRGCEHNCRYCYARYMAVTRFGRCTAEEWAEPVINYSAAAKKYRTTKDGSYVPTRHMFPSSHDITPRNLYQCIEVIGNLLEAGNDVLIVSKPHWSCITEICDTFRASKSRIMFRFTIGSMDDEVLGFWEPGAPRFAERFACLRNAHHFGYQTSVSCEPYLDPYILELYKKVKPYITDSFWIGKLRDFNNRVDLTGVTEAQLWQHVYPLRAIQEDPAFQEIFQQLDGREFVRWKDGQSKWNK